MASRKTQQPPKDETPAQTGLPNAVASNPGDIPTTEPRDPVITKLNEETTMVTY